MFKELFEKIWKQVKSEGQSLFLPHRTGHSKPMRRTTKGNVQKPRNLEAKKKARRIMARESRRINRRRAA